MTRKSRAFYWKCLYLQQWAAASKVNARNSFIILNKTLHWIKVEMSAFYIKRSNIPMQKQYLKTNRFRIFKIWFVIMTIDRIRLSKDTRIWAWQFYRCHNKGSHSLLVQQIKHSTLFTSVYWHLLCYVRDKASKRYE